MSICSFLGSLSSPVSNIQLRHEMVGTQVMPVEGREAPKKDSKDK